MKGRILALVTLLLVCAQPNAGLVTAGTDTRQILAEQEKILKEIETPQGKYSRFNDQAQRNLKDAQSKIFALLSGGRSLQDLRKDEQVELLNSVEEIKAIISSNHRDKLECWREAKLGTKLKITRCETVATRARLMEEARSFKSDVSSCQMGETGAAFCGPPDN